MKFLKLSAVLGLFIITACGDGDDQPVTLPVGNPLSPTADITLSRTDVSFAVRQKENSPESQTFEISWSDTSVAEIVTAFPNGTTQPSWLNITQTGTTSPVMIELQTIDTELATGTYTTTVNVIARNASGTQLALEPVEITYEVRDNGESKRANSSDIFHFGQAIVLNGANIGWSEDSGDWYNRDFGTADAMDAPRTNLTAFETHFNNIAMAGGNSARIWVHTGATNTPVLEPNGTVSGLSRELTDEQVVAQLDAVLDAAWDQGVLVTFNLFSFNMLCDAFTPQAAKTLLEDNIQTYIDNALTPLVLGVKDHPAMFSWDIFNEPEGMSQANFFCPSTETLGTEPVQNVVNQVAAAIHALDPNVKVTTSTHTDLFDDYSNSTLLALPDAHPNGTIDFYSLHWYDTGWMVSPHVTMAGEFNADKPVIVGEYDVENTGAGGPTAQASVEHLLNNGYAGAWPWALSTGDVALITSAISQGAPLSTTIDRAAIEACLQDRPTTCYTE